MNKILVLCYPSHTTHILQGLNVVMFAIIKRYLSEEWDKWEHKTGEKISKLNFLAVYDRAHNCALTPETIKTSFCKTGVWPFDPTIITKNMMASSKVTSFQAHLPVPPAMPVHVLADLLQKVSLEIKYLIVTWRMRVMVMPVEFVILLLEGVVRMSRVAMGWPVLRSRVKKVVVRPAVVGKKSWTP